MLALEVVLDFSCCYCGNYMGLTLKCEGDRLDEELDSVAMVKAPCPTCHKNVVVYFSPAGTLHRVDPETRMRDIPELVYN